MIDISRRGFLAGSVAGAAALAAKRSLAASGGKKNVKASDIVRLGQSGIQTSVLGIGTGTHGGRDQLGLGQAGFTKLARHAFDRGVRYIDTADNYRTHLFVRFAIEGLPRENFFIQTKTPAKHPEVAKADIERFRREMDCGHIDCLLMHCMRTDTWKTDMRPVMDVLYDAKEKGRVGSVGISCHGMDPLAVSTDCDWIDVQLVRINPFGIKMDGTPDEVAGKIQEMKASGRGVLGMKIYGEGALETREQRLQSLKYVFGLGTVDAFTIGFTSIAQIDETFDLIEEATA